MTVSRPRRSHWTAHICQKPQSGHPIPTFLARSRDQRLPRGSRGELGATKSAFCSGMCDGIGKCVKTVTFSDT